MKKIQDYVDMIDEELEGAKCYAEKYVEHRAKGDMATANKFKEMSNDEIRHSQYLHTLAITEIDELNKVFKAPKEMQDKWDDSHKNYTEKASWVKYMLTLE